MTFVGSELIGPRQIRTIVNFHIARHAEVPVALERVGPGIRVERVDRLQ
jgi:hypothetical protein